MARKTLVEGDVRAIARGGDAVVETEDGVVLVPGALPGERVELELTASKRGAARGRLRRIFHEADARRTPACKDAARCGGCPLMIAAPDTQREIKLGFLREACRGLPGAAGLELGWVTSPLELGYRRRARFAWHRDTLGYRQLHSKRVSEIDECIVLMEPLRLAWNEVRDCLAPSLRGDGEIQLQLSGREGVVVGLHSKHEQAPTLYAACDALSKRARITGVTLRMGQGGAPATWGETQVLIGEGEAALEAPSGAFSQANDGINAKLIEAVLELAQPEGMKILELHSGIGNFTIPLAREAGTLVAVEQDPRSVEACQENLKRRGLQARIVLGDANHPPKGRHEVLVLDPPRQGARALFEHSDVLPGPKRIVYVSCDTATLARDLRLAAEKGYGIDRAIGFDMFPQTAHLESLVRLVRV